MLASRSGRRRPAKSAASCAEGNVLHRRPGMPAIQHKLLCARRVGALSHRGMVLSTRSRQLDAA